MSKEQQAPVRGFGNDAAVAAIQFVLRNDVDETLTWLRLWNEGSFDVCRREWPEAPEECYTGADPATITTDRDPAPVSEQPPETKVQLAASRERRIYIAGPMTGIAEFNFPTFNDAASMLRAEGWHVENPADHGVVEGATWTDYLHYDLGRLATCSAIYLLPMWEKSRGAVLEVHIANALGMVVKYAPGAAKFPEQPAAQTAGVPVELKLRNALVNFHRNSPHPEADAGDVEAAISAIKRAFAPQPLAEQVDKSLLDSMLDTLRMIAWSNDSRWQSNAANQEIAKFNAAIQRQLADFGNQKPTLEPNEDVKDARLFRKLLSYEYWHRQELVRGDDIREAINRAPNRYRTRRS